MAKFLIAIVAAVACLVLVNSLECNKCSGSFLGVCLNSGTETCTTNTSVCYTSKASFPSIKGFSSFGSQGCTESTTCGSSNSSTTNGTLPIVRLAYTIKTTCCSADKCNPMSGASASTVSLSMLSVAALASVMRSVM